MKEIGISEFGVKFSAMVQQVRRSGKPIRVTRFGWPLAEIVPPPSLGAAAEAGEQELDRSEVVPFPIRT